VPLIFDRVASESALAELYAHLVKVLHRNLEVNGLGQVSLFCQHSMKSLKNKFASTWIKGRKAL
jgi:hypothetical protein